MQRMAKSVSSEEIAYLNVHSLQKFLPVKVLSFEVPKKQSTKFTSAELTHFYLETC